MANYNDMQYIESSPAIQVDFNKLMRRVFTWMILGVGLTALVSFVTTSWYTTTFTAAINGDFGAIETLNTMNWVFLGSFIVQLVMVIALVAGINKFSSSVATLIFLGYAALMGFSLSGMLTYYLTTENGIVSIAGAFLSATALFAVMAVVGYTTRVDLSKYSTYFMMGLIGLVIALVINMFLRSSAFDFIISCFGVILFTALTAWDVQKIKKMSEQPEMQVDGEPLRKMSILGALTLYLDFINLFIYLLRIFGRR